MLTKQNLDAGCIHLGPGRDLRDSPEVARHYPDTPRARSILHHERENSTTQSLAADHAAILDTRLIRDGT